MSATRTAISSLSGLADPGTAITSTGLSEGSDSSCGLECRPVRR